MSTFIALQIMKAYDTNGLEAGQAKYRGYFISTKLYLAYKADCDTILTTDGYSQVIVTV
ncbi:hypothetical protein [Clostridium beijerinckii]|uniref:hypothetical protein n=1 Tax=Clostridium beijerinckii TaxID=1520 RepID=UPI0015714ABB|nr:hypothetical protein [Clostridium beijerinckii]NRU52596.1 hypothetical protein [Clostridium beijerinckii]NYC68639.1 hypothetical protein [Clostridium beijerinckii]